MHPVVALVTRVSKWTSWGDVSRIQPRRARGGREVPSPHGAFQRDSSKPSTTASSASPIRPSATSRRRHADKDLISTAATSAASSAGPPGEADASLELSPSLHRRTRCRATDNATEAVKVPTATPVPSDPPARRETLTGTPSRRPSHEGRQAGEVVARCSSPGGEPLARLRKILNQGMLPNPN